MNVVHYMRYNYPAAIEQHKVLLLAKDKEFFAEGVRLLQTTNLSPHQVRMQLGYNDKFLKFIQEHHPELQWVRVFNNSTRAVRQKLPNTPRQSPC